MNKCFKCVHYDVCTKWRKPALYGITTYGGCDNHFKSKSNYVQVVRCRDCKHRGRETYCPMFFEEWYEIDEGDGYYDSDFTIHDRTIDEGFCDRGEREDNE